MLELAVDAERGILLDRAVFVGGELRSRTEVLEVAFDEMFAPETFVWKPSPDRPLPEVPQVEPILPQEVSLQEAAGVAAFAVFALDLPEQWHWHATYKPEVEWKYKGPRPPFYAEAVWIEYRLEDASHQLRLDQAAGDVTSPFMDQQGEWEPRECSGGPGWVWPAAQTSGYAGCVRFLREGTVLTITSMTLETEQLLQLADRLVRVQ